jgi:hypothetical protein
MERSAIKQYYEVGMTPPRGSLSQSRPFRRSLKNRENTHTAKLGVKKVF